MFMRKCRRINCCYVLPTSQIVKNKIKNPAPSRTHWRSRVFHYFLDRRPNTDCYSYLFICVCAACVHCMYACVYSVCACVCKWEKSATDGDKFVISVQCLHLSIIQHVMVQRGHLPLEKFVFYVVSCVCVCLNPHHVRQFGQNKKSKCSYDS